MDQKDHFENETINSLNEEITKNSKSKFIEYKIKDLKKEKNGKTKISFEFKLNEYKWRIIYYPNGNNSSVLSENAYVSLYLENIDCIEKINSNLYCSLVLYIRNFDYSNYYYKSISKIFFNNKSPLYGFDEFLEIKNLTSHFNIKYGRSTEGSFLLENNKMIIGVYLRIYDDYSFKEELESHITNNGCTIEKKFLLYEWKIEKWKKLVVNKNTLEKRSEIIEDKDNNEWRLFIYPNGIDRKSSEYCSFILENLKINNSNQYLITKCVFFIRNYNHKSCSFMKTNNKFIIFNNNQKCFGFNEFIRKKSLFEKNSNNDSLINDDKTVLGIYIILYKNDNYYKCISNREENILYKDILIWNLNKNIINRNWNYSSIYNIYKYKWKIGICKKKGFIYLRLININASILNDIEYLEANITVSTNKDWINNDNNKNFSTTFKKNSFILEKNFLKLEELPSDNFNIYMYICINKLNKEIYQDCLKKQLIYNFNQETKNKNYLNEYNSNKYIFKEIKIDYNNFFTNDKFLIQINSWIIRLLLNKTENIFLKIEIKKIENDENDNDFPSKFVISFRNINELLKYHAISSNCFTRIDKNTYKFEISKEYYNKYIIPILNNEISICFYHIEPKINDSIFERKI